MIEFVTENNLCREQILLHYFDEHVMESCGRCDVCMQQQPIQVYPQAQMRDIIWQTLSEKSIDTEAITQLFPKTQRTDVLNCLREMREEAKVGKDAYGKWYCLK
jgi:ATP-dependent DNA helicase RecQ